MNKQRARGIGWCDYTWSPVTGCTPISEGCENCYAKRMAEGRLRGRCGYPADEPFKPIMHWNRAGNARKLPMKKKIFVGSMGDIFHKNHSFKDLEALFAILDVWGDISEDTVLMFLTKRPQRMKGFFEYYAGRAKDDNVGLEWHFPKNWWLGISAENQPRLDERLHHLLQIPAAVRFVSLEPLLGITDPSPYLEVEFYAGDEKPAPPGINTKPYRPARLRLPLNWIIVGAETGPGARPYKREWIQSIIEQCRSAGVPLFLKDNLKWPEEIKEFPEEVGGWTATTAAK